MTSHILSTDQTGGERVDRWEGPHVSATLVQEGAKPLVALVWAHEQIQGLALQQYAVSLDEVGNDNVISERLTRRVQDERGLVPWVRSTAVTCCNGVLEIVLCKYLKG